MKKNLYYTTIYYLFVILEYFLPSSVSGFQEGDEKKGYQPNSADIYYHSVAVEQCGELLSFCPGAAVPKYFSADNNTSNGSTISSSDLKGRGNSALIRVSRRALKCSTSDITVNGTLELLKDGCYFKSGNIYYAPRQYCLISLGVARICNETTLIRKCCGVTEAYNFGSGECDEVIAVGQSYFPRVRATPDNPIKLMGKEDDVLLSFVVRPVFKSVARLGIKSIYGAENISSISSSTFYLTDSGVLYEPFGLYLRGQKKPLTLPYCLERTQFKNGTDIMLLYDLTEEITTRNYAVAMAICYLITVPFALATAIAHVWIIQRNIHGFTLAGYFIAASSTRILAASVAIISSGDMMSGLSGCTAVDILQKIFYCANVCWMTLINFDLWLTFRKVRAWSPAGLCRFPLYLLFGFGIPALNVLIAWAFGQEERKATGSSHEFCVMYEFSALVSFSVLIVILIAVNLGWFLRTSYHIKRQKDSTENVLRSSQCTVSRKSFKLFSKLFLMTGSIWVIRTILLFSHFTYWYLSVPGVILEAIFVSPEIIFFFLVFSNEDTKKKFRNKFPILTKIFPAKSPSSPDSSSNGGLPSIPPGRDRHQSHDSLNSNISLETIASHI